MGLRHQGMFSGDRSALRSGGAAGESRGADRSARACSISSFLVVFGVHVARFSKPFRTRGGHQVSAVQSGFFTFQAFLLRTQAGQWFYFQRVRPVGPVGGRPVYRRGSAV